MKARGKEDHAQANDTAKLELKAQMKKELPLPPTSRLTKQLPDAQANRDPPSSLTMRMTQQFSSHPKAQMKKDLPSPTQQLSSHMKASTIKGPPLSPSMIQFLQTSFHLRTQTNKESPSPSTMSPTQ